MVLKDRIYGIFEIDDPVVGELISTYTFQRLKSISQFGVPNEFYHIIGFSRYEHSIGVYLLLRKLGTSREEQIAGLLHDVSHHTFSHVVDWVIGQTQNEEGHESQHLKIIGSTEISSILIKYGLDPAKIANLESFVYLDRPLPDLCADRIDYAFREFPLETARDCFENLLVNNIQIAFASKSAAKLFAVNFLKLQVKHWGGFEGTSRYQLLAQLLSRALDLSLITEKDFRGDERYIVDQIKSSSDKEISAIRTMLKNKSLSKYKSGDQIVYKKFRYVDPLYLKDGNLYRLSETDNKFRAEIAKAKLANQKGIVVPQVAYE